MIHNAGTTAVSKPSCLPCLLKISNQGKQDLMLYHCSEQIIMLAMLFKICNQGKQDLMLSLLKKLLPKWRSLAQYNFLLL